MLQLTPLFYIYGCEDNLTNMSQYKKARKNAEKLHKKAFKYANKFVENKLGDSRIVYHHTPFL